jgi:hypothetical protein
MATGDKQCVHLRTFQKLHKTHITSELFQLKNLKQHLEGLFIPQVTECSGSAKSYTRSMMVQLGYV